MTTPEMRITRIWCVAQCLFGLVSHDKPRGRRPLRTCRSDGRTGALRFECVEEGHELDRECQLEADLIDREEWTFARNLDEYAS